jgi:hypothetical protein
VLFLVEQADLLQRIEKLKEKLNRNMRRMAGLQEKSKLLEMHYEDARAREGNTNELVMELLERQRELNVMLNRANIMLNRTQEAMALSSMELNEMAKALPEPKKAEWADRVSRVNDLFRQTGVQDAELGALESGSARPSPDSFDASELKKGSEEAFGKKQSLWEAKERREPPRVQAEVVEEEPQPQAQEGIKLTGEDIAVKEEPRTDPPATYEATDQSDEQSLLFSPRRKSWWRKTA